MQKRCVLFYIYTILFFIRMIKCSYRENGKNFGLEMEFGL